MPKTYGAVLTKAETASRIALNRVFQNRNYVDRSKQTSENEARTSAGVVEEPMAI